MSDEGRDRMGSRQHGKYRRTSLQLNGQQTRAVRWASGIADTDVKDAKTGRSIKAHPETLASTSASSSMQQDVPMSSPTALLTDRRRSSGSSAASLLMEATTFSQTPAQNVSDALLGKVQMEAANEQSRRRSSVPGLSLQEMPPSAFQSGNNELQPSSTKDNEIQLAGITSSFSSQSSYLSNASNATTATSGSTLEIGDIAIAVAAKEYIEQVDLLTAVHAEDSVKTPTQHSIDSLSSSSRRFDDNNPFQGVPSLPLTPSASLAMLPPADLTSIIPTPLSPTSSRGKSQFQPTYRLAAEEYHVLASAAAVATVALTTAVPNHTSSLTSSSNHDITPSNGESVLSHRQLTLEEQEEITSTLKAWAGLEGADRQQEARRKLQERQQQLNENVNGGGTEYFPPDFARHYKSQLTALAAGYYQKLHNDGLTESLYPSPANQANERTKSNEGLQQDKVLEMKTQAEAVAAAQESIKKPDQLRQDKTLQTQHEGQARSAEAAIDPMQIITNASNASGLEVNSPQIRDHLLQYAHNLYSTGSSTVAVGLIKSNLDAKDGPRQQMHPTLLPLLHTLHNLHPTHLPTLLLLSCAYYSSGDLAASLWYNKQILQIDANYVESMSNIGTTLRALGRSKEAESWWWKAIKLRPGYWDAYENLLGVLCSSHEDKASSQSIKFNGTQTNGVKETIIPRFAEALILCEYVESHVLAKRQGDEGENRIRKVAGGDNRPICMPATLPIAQASRLQNLLYAKGNLKYVMSDHGNVGAAKEYQKAVEMMISSSEQSAYSLRDLVMATYVVGILTFGVEMPEAAGTNATAEIAQALGFDPSNSQQAQLAASGQYNSLSSGGVLRLVRDAGDALVKVFLRLAGGHLPMLMLLPESARKLCLTLFPESQGHLPAIISSALAQKTSSNSSSVRQIVQQASSMTSTVLLTLSKLFQDSTGTAATSPQGHLTLGGIPASTSLLLPFYYLSLALSPSASTANNLGILLSSIPASSSVVNADGKRQLLNGQAMALQYYTYGLQMDSKHPHLYTNFGSLLKDLNKLNEAIQMYEKAIEYNPDFDVALANLGNAIKDQGRTQDSIKYYRRAVQVNRNFPEALCGLVNALLAICDWKEVYGEGDDEQGVNGYMKNIRNLLEKQLDEGSLYGMRALSAEGTVEDWVNLVIKSTGDSRESFKTDLHRSISTFYDDKLERKGSRINEGSFVIRLIETLLRKSQRRWYLDYYVKGGNTEKIKVQPSDIQKYPKIPLPSCLVAPSVPTVLPFHTFTLKIPPRHIRLISHRNALRISQATLTQLWLPRHIYPPPPPPQPKMKVGYISSDFNNHPLAHLMQSVFGFHNRDEFEIYLYASTASDHSPYRCKIEKEAHHFIDVSTKSNQDIIKRVLDDGIHILMNLNGYTKGARNEIFAARPCPIQMEFMGFAGGLASGWTDWIVADPIVCPPEMTSADRWRANKTQMKPTEWKGCLDPEDESDDWIYTEKFIYMPDTYFVNDHRQGFREPQERESVDGKALVRPHEMSDEEAWKEEEERRWKARKEMWPNIPDNYVIFSDFNQLYKLEPALFKLWLRILKRVPNSILWLLRFPAAGEANLLDYANEHFGKEIASRIIFTEVAPKGVHIHRGRIADLFLDTLECGAHTTSADILWSATPVLTWPKHKHKMASRVAASIVNATGLGKEMIVSSEKEYEDRAVELAQSLRYEYVDTEGNILTPEKCSKTIQADALEVNISSSSATPHNKGKGDASQGQIPGAASNPAPANVKQVASDNNSTSSSSSTSNGAASSSLPSTISTQRKDITLECKGEIAPKGAVSRRSHGPLSDLRKQLFLSRDSNHLFDTKLWVRNLERGYREAWNRFVDGTDSEDTAEWEALDDDDIRKKSGHIWL